MSSSWHEERRADKAAAARTAREDQEHAAKLQREERRRDRDEARAEQAQARRDRAARKQARAAKRQRGLTPGNVYRRGTLGLIGFSIAASLPAQIIHFVSIHWMLFPIGPALEGAAWVLTAGVALADERKLPVWVRWALRALAMSAASYAALINYQYGQSLTSDGLTAGQAQTAAMGLAAVTIGGPLFFEVRQWVLTLTAAVNNTKQRADEKARAKHEAGRRKEFKDVAARADELTLAAPFGTLKPEEAWARAWWDVKGAPLGITASVIAHRLDAEATVAEVLAAAEQTPERLAVEYLLADLFGPDGGAAGTLGVPLGGGPRDGTPKARTALGGKGKRPDSSSSETAASRALEEADLAAVRKLAEALGGKERLSARNVREAIGCRTEYAMRLRDAIQSEQQ